MKKFLLHSAKWGLLLFVFLNIIGWFSLYFLRNSSFYKPQFLVNEIKNKNFDYVIIGSSVGLTTLNTILIDSLTNKKGLNLSIDDTAISSNYLMLKHFYEQGKKTDFCIVAISNWDLSNLNPILNDNDYRFLPYVSEDYVHQYYQNLEIGYFKPLTLSHYFPAIGVCYYNTEIFYPAIVASLFPNKRNRFDANGNYSYPESGTPISKNWSAIKLNWQNPFIGKIEKLCIENNTKLIMYQAPIYKTIIINKNQSYAFINNANAIINKDYFYDHIHLNQKGREKASIIFSKELIRSYFNKQGKIYCF